MSLDPGIEVVTGDVVTKWSMYIDNAKPNFVVTIPVSASSTSYPSLTLYPSTTLYPGG